jgi:hypothetical protein
MKGNVQIEYEKEALEKIRSIAVKNGKKTNLQTLFDLAVEIAVNSIDCLDETDFNMLFNLKK